MAGVEDRVVRENQDTFKDAVHQCRQIAAIVAAAAKAAGKDGIADESGVISGAVVGYTVRSVARCREYLQGYGRIGCQGDGFVATQIGYRIDDDVEAAGCREIPDRVFDVAFSCSVDEDRRLPCPAQLVGCCRMVEVTVREQDFFDGIAFFPYQFSQLVRFRRRIDEKAMLRLFINEEVAVRGKISFYQ